MLILSNIGADLIDQERAITKDLHELMLAKESFFKQKSRIQWLQEGDQNTTFFHGMVVAKQHRNSIIALTSSEGNKLTSYSQIYDEDVTFFQKLIGTTDENIFCCSKAVLADLLFVSLPSEVSQELIRPVTSKDVKKTMFSIEQ